MEVNLSNECKEIILNFICWPTHRKFSLFIQEIYNLVLENETQEADGIFLGDFNICVDDIRNNDAQKILRLQNNLCLVTIVDKPTYNSSHTLDLVIKKVITFLWKI